MGNGYYNFPYNILDVITALQIPVRQNNGTTMDVDCPFCTVNNNNGHTGKGKLNVVIHKNYAHCCRCDFGGGMLEIYSKVKNCSLEVANKEMREFVKTPSYSVVKMQTEEAFDTAILNGNNNGCRASDYDIDRTYRKFLSLCFLSDKHRENLKKRGLTDKQISHYGFKTVPTHREQHRKILSHLLLNEYTLKGVPGFFVDKLGNWNFNLFRFAEGFLIPMVNTKGKCLGLQVRLDNPPKDKGKYIWFSSSYKDSGVSSGSPYHITNAPKTDTLFLTEGGLKADIAHSLSGETFMAVAGVTQLKKMPQYLSEMKELGIKRIVDCFDSDCVFNESVEKSRQKLMRIVLGCGMSYSRLSWDSKYKGIDDYMFAVPKENWQFNVFEMPS